MPPETRTDDLPVSPETTGSVAEDVRGAFAEATAAAEAAPVEPVDAPTPDAPETPASGAGEEQDAAAPDTDTPRDPKGRFAKGAGKTEADTKTDALAETPVKADDAVDTDKPGEVSPLEPPAYWSLEDQQMFRKQPEEVQKWMAERDGLLASNHTKKTQELAEKSKRYEEFDRVLAPHRKAAAQQGMTEAGYVNSLFEISNFANRDPAAFLKWFAAERKVDLAPLAFAAPAPAVPAAGDDDIFADPAAPAVPAASDPAIHGLQTALDTLGAQVNKITGSIAERSSADQQNQDNQVAQAIDQFRAATDDNGSPKFPYFDEVRGLMGQLLSPDENGNRRAETMEAAYDMAVHATPETRAKLEAARDATAARKRQEERKGKADAAQRAGSSITGSPAGSTMPTPKATVREEVEAAFHATS